MAIHVLPLRGYLKERILVIPVKTGIWNLWIPIPTFVGMTILV